MKATILVNRRNVASRVVGVIASPVALVRATRLRRPPDLFELRLDALRDSLGEVERMIPQLRAPLILTARHPAEGGVGGLSASGVAPCSSAFSTSPPWSISNFDPSGK